MNTTTTTTFLFSATLSLLGNAGCFHVEPDGSDSDEDGGGVTGGRGEDDGTPPTSECPSAYDWKGVVDAFQLCDKSAIFRENVSERHPDGTFVWHQVRVDDAYDGEGGAASFNVALPSGSNGAATWEAIADDGTYRYYLVLDHHLSFDAAGKNARIGMTRGPSQPPPPGAPFERISYEEYISIEDGTAVEFSSQDGKLTIAIDGVLRQPNVPAPAPGNAPFTFSILVGNPAFYSQTAGIGARDIEFTQGVQPPADSPY